MDRQVIFNTVVEGARKQGRRSTGVGYDSEDGGFPLTVCRFRSEDHKGDKCFIGMIIPDTIYRSEMEKGGVSALLSRWPEFSNSIGVKYPDEGESNNQYLSDLNFLNHLRMIHDLKKPEEWEGEFELCAKLFDLKVPVS